MVLSQIKAEGKPRMQLEPAIRNDLVELMCEDLAEDEQAFA
jgi:hypothetical protein